MKLSKADKSTNGQGGGTMSENTGVGQAEEEAEEVSPSFPVPTVHPSPTKHRLSLHFDFGVLGIHRKRACMTDEGPAERTTERPPSSRKIARRTPGSSKFLISLRVPSV
eukprot:4166637-Prymnesium_polylepis.2